jgi:phosphotransacetylase
VSLAGLVERAVRRPVRILLAGGDSAVLEDAAARLTHAGLPDAAVVGSGALHPEGHARIGSVALLLRSREPNRVRDGIHALDLAADPVRFATGLAALGDADAVVTGPGVTYGSLTAAAEWTLGAPLDGGPVHAATWLLLADGDLVACADCAFPGEQTPAAKARMARSVAHTHARLTGEAPRVVFLTGPAQGNDDRGAEEAVDRLKALDPGVMAEADPAARFRGRANVLIFPGGTAGHLAVRTVRALSGARLLGPMLVGVPGTVAGVAEDADVDELVGTAALAVLAAGTAAT